jgi:uroporphyrinogen decarboxylase
MEYGASGIFYATNGWASESLLTSDQYREFGEQYDLEFLDAIKSRAKLNILHNCGTHIYFDQLASYPVHALSWAAGDEGNPDLLDGHKRSGKAVMGGVKQQTLKTGSPSQVRDEVAQALELTGGRSLLLAPGCAVPPETPAKNLEAVRAALS